MQVAIAPDLLRFHCPHCRAELTVPKTLAGIQGPCPSCFQTIQAPAASAPAPAPAAVLPPRQVTPLVPIPAPVASRAVTPMPLSERAGMQAQAAAAPRAVLPPPRNEEEFRPKRAIPPMASPPDEGWKNKARTEARREARARRAERAAQRFLDSRVFRLGRLVALVAVGGVLAWLVPQAMNQAKKGGRPSDSSAAPLASTPAPGPDVAPGDEPDVIPTEEIPTIPVSDYGTGPATTGALAAPPDRSPALR